MTKSLSIFLYIIAVASVFILVETHSLFAPNPLVIIIQVLSVALMIWARITLGFRSLHSTANTTEGPLITHGPYKYWRHPIYASIIYFISASLISYPLVLTLAMVALVSGAFIIRALLEEKFLHQAYPEYEEYANRTKRFIPFVI